MVRTKLNIGCRYSTPVRERPLHPTRAHFTPEPSQTQAPVTPATEPERRAGGSLTTGNDLSAATDHHPADVTAHPDVAMAIGHRHRVVVGLVTDQRLRADLSGSLGAGLQGRRRRRGHGLQIPRQALSDAERYLASFARRYNRRYQLQTMIPRFVLRWLRKIGQVAKVCTFKF